MKEFGQLCDRDSGLVFRKDQSLLDARPVVNLIIRFKYQFRKGRPFQRNQLFYVHVHIKEVFWKWNKFVYTRAVFFNLFHFTAPFLSENIWLLPYMLCYLLNKWNALANWDTLLVMSTYNKGEVFFINNQERMEMKPFKALIKKDMFFFNWCLD